jgi:hypothetical protein
MTNSNLVDWECHGADYLSFPKLSVKNVRVAVLWASD